MKPLLQIEHLRIQFENAEKEINEALRGVSLHIEKGKTLGIVGESGSGKSITSLAIMRLLAKSAKIVEGSILWEDKNLLDISEIEIQQIRGNEIAMIFQEPMTSLNPTLTCGFQVAESLILHKGMTKSAAKNEVLRLFEEVELPNPERIFETYPHEISGGQKQRVMIAMAISCKPKLLIADEPTTALDVTVQKSVLELLKRLQKTHEMTMIFISHDLGVIGAIADQVAVMYKGEIVEQGTVTTIFQNPEHPYTQGLLACRPRMDIRRNRLPSVKNFLEKTADSPEFQLIASAEYQTRKKYLAQQPCLLSVKNLSTHFPVQKGFWSQHKEVFKAVDKVSFEVYKGETLGLVGESGCGKTTLSRSLLRLIEPTEGEILFEGQNVRALSQKELRPLRKNMQLIFQDPYSSLNPRMTIGEAILEPMDVHGLHKNRAERVAKVKEWLERVELSPDFYHRFPHEFSGGQRQRICIARALALAPEFVICDESVSALDVSVQAQVLNLLKDLQAEFGFSYIFISHDLSVVKHISNRILVMQKGKIVESNDAEELYRNPEQDYTKELLRAVL